MNLAIEQQIMNLANKHKDLNLAVSFIRATDALDKKGLKPTYDEPTRGMPWEQVEYGVVRDGLVQQLIVMNAVDLSFVKEYRTTVDKIDIGFILDLLAENMETPMGKNYIAEDILHNGALDKTEELSIDDKYDFVMSSVRRLKIAQRAFIDELKAMGRITDILEYIIKESDVYQEFKKPNTH